MAHPWRGKFGPTPLLSLSTSYLHDTRICTSVQIAAATMFSTCVYAHTSNVQSDDHSNDDAAFVRAFDVVRNPNAAKET